MKVKEAPKSPVFPADQAWHVRKREGVYESDITALLRTLAEDEKIRKDQRFAWDRWRNDESLRDKP